MSTTQQCNSVKAQVVSDGSYQLDGGALFGGVGKSEWERFLKPDRKNRVRMGLNCLVVSTPSGNVLVNTGIGNNITLEEREEYNCSPSKLLRQLRIKGFRPGDIHYVVLTHLHFDHSGGALRREVQHNKLVPTFPKARYIIQTRAWEEAHNLNARSTIAYGPGIQNLHVLDEMGRIDFVDGDHEVVPGVDMVVTDGYSNGHSIVKINTGSERYGYLADLIPTHAHLYKPCITNLDRDPEQTLRAKEDVMETAMREGWLLVFAHGHHVNAGYLTREGLSPVELA